MSLSVGAEVASRSPSHRREQPEPLRLQFAPEWLDLADQDEPLAVWPLPSRPPEEPVAPALGCRRCGGILNHSRVSRLDRLVTLFTTRQPLRCVDCRARDWHPRATAENPSAQTQGMLEVTGDSAV